MIEKLLAALAEGGRDGGPRPGVGAEEIADILWLATRVDAAPDRPPPPGHPPLPPGRPDDPEPADSSPELPGTPRAAAEADTQYFPAAGPAPAAPSDPAARPHTDSGPGAARGTATAPPVRRGTALRLPRAASLDDPLALMRALRPVGRRNIGGPGEELDEQLTVERSIERMVLTPVLRPAESRWLDVALVVDAHHSMLLWSDLVDEVRAVLTRSGVFRDVRTWQLTGTGPGGTPMVTHGRGTPPRNPLELADPAGRRLILVLSDTVAGGWREAPLRGVLRQWSAHNSVAVLNVLPERLWTRGAVRPVPFAVRADRPAAATRSWQRVPVVRRARGGGAVVPVVGIASGSLARLVRVVSGDGRWRRLACLRLDAEPARGPAYGTPGPPEPFPDPLEVVERFRASASPTAQRLAAHLAAVPLTLPVMTLVRRSLLRESEHSHLAEVALGGLFAPWGGEQEPDHVQFEFLPGVREALLGSQLRGDVAAVRELVRRRVWEYMSRHRGTGRDFPLIRHTPRGDGRREVPPGAQPFATAPGPVAGPASGLADRVVRVRFEALREPQAVGVLLSPRLVLTVGESPGRANTFAWVRVRGQEFLCHRVWGDGAAPQVLLLVSEVDLVDPADRPAPAWAEGFAAPGDHLVVDGATDQGEPTVLTGEVLPYEGERNGELVRLSAEPEVWTHYAGAPVSHDGRLAGIVHTVWPDRMVFLTGRALLEQPGFREVMTTHGRTGAGLAGKDLAGKDLAGDEPAATGSAATGPAGICLAVRPAAAVGPAGRPVEREITELLMRVRAETGAPGVVAPLEDGVLLVTVADPGALGKAGSLLSELPMALSRLRTGSGEWEVSLAVALARGAFTAGADGVRGPAADEAAGLVRHPAVTENLRRSGGPGSVVVVAGESLGGVGDIDALTSAWLDLGPTADPGADARTGTGAETGARRAAGGWFCQGGAADAGRALIDADLRGDDPVVDWSRCGHGSTGADPDGCLGIRLPDRGRCLAHATPSDLAAYLAALGPGSEVDLRGTTFADGLLERLLSALRDPRTGHVRMRGARFDRARFADDWATVGGEFEGRTSFDRAVFEGGPAEFDTAHFKGSASFGRTVFRRGAAFGGAVFDGEARFGRADFGGDAAFTGAVFGRGLTMAWAELWDGARMDRMRVHGVADFAHTVFHGENAWTRTDLLGSALFRSAVWGGATRFDEVYVGGWAAFDEATFAAPAVFENTVFADRASFGGADFADSGEFTDVAFADLLGLPAAWAPLLPRSGAATFRVGGAGGGAGATTGP